MENSKNLPSANKMKVFRTSLKNVTAPFTKGANLFKTKKGVAPFTQGDGTAHILWFENQIYYFRYLILVDLQIVFFNLSSFTITACSYFFYNPTAPDFFSYHQSLP
jgi:hypothetical protein